MSEHRVTVEWQRGEHDFSYEAYPRDHVWQVAGHEIAASAAPGYLGSADRVDPEEAFVAAVSSCHMLTFLAVAAKKRIVVDRYADHAVGHLEKNAQGKLAITRIVLRPAIEFSGDNQPSRDELAHLHHRAHEHCFIANSVHAEVTVEDP